MDLASHLRLTAALFGDGKGLGRIDGMGLLVFNSMVNRDYNVVMGVILLSSIMVMIGRLFSDILYVLVDPRIRLD